MGPVLSPEEARRSLPPAEKLVACGDVVTQTLLGWGVVPFAAVVDGKTHRSEPIPLDQFRARIPRGHRKARNPAGELTAELQQEVHDLVHGGGGLLIVDGEEDLAVLPLVRELPLGTTLIYGQPGAGLCFLTLDRRVKESVQRILDGMEARPSDHGH